MNRLFSVGIVLLHGLVFCYGRTALGSASMLPTVRIPIENISVRDQGDLSICYACAGATLLEARKVAHGDKNPDHPSSLDMALQEEILHPGHDLNSGGTAAQVLEDVKKTGICDLSLPSNKSSHSDDADQLRRQFQDLEKCKKASELANRSPTTDGTNQNSSGRCIVRTIPTVSLPDLKSLGKASGSDEAVSLLKRGMASACSGNRKKVGGYSVKYHSLPHPKALVEDIKTQFTQPLPLQPLTVGYCANLLIDGRRYSGVNWEQDGPKPKKDCEKHESVIMGSRVHQGRNQVLIQNSWGTSCNVYSSDWSQDCENGRIWVDADTLANNAFETTHLEDEKK